MPFATSSFLSPTGHAYIHYVTMFIYVHARAGKILHNYSDKQMLSARDDECFTDKHLWHDELYGRICSNTAATTLVGAQGKSPQAHMSWPSQTCLTGKNPYNQCVSV